MEYDELVPQLRIQLPEFDAWLQVENEFLWKHPVTWPIIGYFAHYVTDLVDTRADDDVLAACFDFMEDALGESNTDPSGVLWDCFYCGHGLGRRSEFDAVHHMIGPRIREQMKRWPTIP